MSRKTVTFDRNPLFGGPTLAERARSGSPFRFLPLSDIDVDPDQPRRVFTEESLSELSASIREYGVLCPILVRATAGGTFRLIAGERRLRAAKLAGLESIPAVIDAEGAEDEAILGKQLVENLQREALTPMERALAIGHLRDKFGISIRDISRKLGISKGLVQRSLEILALPDDLQAALVAGAAETKILVLSRIQDREVRKQVLAELDARTREDLEQFVRALEGGATGDKVYHRGTRKTASKLSTEDQRILSDIQNGLGTKVKLLRSKKDRNRGRISIDFYSAEELEEIYRRLT